MGSACSRSVPTRDLVRTKMRWLRLALSGVIVASLADTSVSAQNQPVLLGGRNVNMLGGSQILSIDPFLVRGDVLRRSQNEPSCAISTRNPQHILCGGNDYRMVDVPGVTTTQIIRDAWLGEFQSKDGGDTWESTLYGGFFLSPAPHPLKTLGLRAAADPVVRSGPAGLAFYTGIAFKQDKSASALHVTTYLDLDSLESDDMPFKVVRTAVVAQAKTPQFIDKPWMFVEAAPDGLMCTLQVSSGQTNGFSQTQFGQLMMAWLSRWPGFKPKGPVFQQVPASIVHIVYTVFLDQTDTTAAIMYTRSDNCGQSFSKPVRLNPTAERSVGGDEHGNGATVAKPLATGAQLMVATWRRVQARDAAGHRVGPTDAIMSALSRDNGRTWTAPLVVEEICPFEQATTATSFRTTAFPSMTADASGRFYVAWSDRRRVDGVCDISPINDAPDGAGRIRVATSTDGIHWTSTIAVPPTTPHRIHQIQPSIVFTAGRLFLAWIDFQEDRSGQFSQFVNEADVFFNTPAIRHTADVRASMALPAPAPDFASGVTRISEFLKGVFTVGGRRVVGQLQFDAVNRRWARRGTVPFDGDYIDIGTRPYLPPEAGGVGWTPNNEATRTTALGAVPFAPNLLVAWADNRDMRAVPGVDNKDTVAVPYMAPGGLTLPPASIFDPTQTRPVCTVSADAFKTSTMDQNTYSSRLSVGFVAAAPTNHKTLGTLQRTFALFVRNDDAAIVKSFRLIVTPPAGGFASFDQFVTNRQTIDVNVPPRSSVARTVYVTRNPASQVPLDPKAPVPVDVIEMSGGTPLLAARVLLNGDPTAPEIDGPEIDGQEVFTPEIDGPEIDGTSVPSPEIDGLALESPEIDGETWRALGLGGPEIDGPEIDGIEVDSPEIDGPEIDGSTLTDARFSVKNVGNTRGQYNAKAFAARIPGADFHYQIVVRRIYTLPAVNSNCQATTVKMSKVVVNLRDVQLGTPEIDGPEIDGSAIDTASFLLGPGESADVIIRAGSPSGLIPTVDTFELAVQQEAVNSRDAAAGVTEPPVVTTYLTIGTSALPSGRVGTPYSTLLFASGGVEPFTWTLAGGSLPAGLTLTSGGQIAGTPTVADSFGFTVRVTDSAFPAVTATRFFTIAVTSSGTANLAFVTQPTDTPAGTVITPAPSVRAFDPSGAVVPGLAVTLQLLGGTDLVGTLTRTTGATGVAAFNDLSIASVQSGLQLRASAPGFGIATSATFATVPVVVPPTVTVAAPDKDGAEAGSDPASFSVSRTGSTATPLTVFLALTGSATDGTDYNSDDPTTSVTIPAGQSSVILPIAVVDDDDEEGTEQVFATITPDAAYVVGGLSAAANIIDNDEAQGFIAGVVQTSSLAPVGGVTVEVYDAGGTLVTSGISNGLDGSYIAAELPVGAYFVRTRNGSLFNLIDELYNDQPCVPECDVTAGTSVLVSAANTTSGIDFTLARSGSISGTVTDAATTLPLPFASLQIQKSGVTDPSKFIITSADINGFYQVDGLEPGSYFVRTLTGLVDEVWNNIACVGCNPLSGTPVVVTADAVASNIDFALGAGALITGTVRDSGTLAPLANVPVQIYTTTGSLVGTVLTDGTGGYASTGLTAGTYVVRTLVSEVDSFVSGTGLDVYVDRLFSGVDCAVSCDVTTGSPVVVGAPGSVTPNINFSLTVGGGITRPFDVSTFVSATGATNATGPLPDAGAQTSLTVGSVTFTTAPGGTTLDFGGGAGREWYQPLAGNEVRLGVERLQLDFALPVTAAGFYFVEPHFTMPPHGGAPADSLYEVTLYNGTTAIRRYRFNAPDDFIVFIGVQSTSSFTRMRIVDLTGNPDDEYFGEVFTKVAP
jgi:putative Ig domain-containing protein